MKTPLLLCLLASAVCPLAAEPAPPLPQAQHPQIGVCVHFSNGWYTEAEMPAMIAEAGFSWVREDFYWAKMEKEKGVYVMPDDYRKTIDAMHAAGLNILAIFNGSNKLYAPNDYDPEAYAKAAAWFARETKGKVQAIEILNEPHNFGFSKHHGGRWNGREQDGTMSPWVPKYVELLNKAAPIIKEANPALKVVGLGGVPPVTFRQLEMGINPAVDGVTDHPYSPRMTAEYVPYADSEGIVRRDGIATADARGTFVSQERMMRAQSAKHNGPGELWLTEFGWPAYQENKNGNLFAGFTQEAQAKYLLRRMAESLGVGSEMIFLYNFRDNGKDRHNAEHNFGLLDINMKPKPAFHAVKRFNRIMTGYTPESAAEVNLFPITSHPDHAPVIWDGSKIEVAGNHRAYSFANKQGAKLVLVWSVERAGGDLQPTMADIQIASDRPAKAVQAYNFYTGETVSVPFENREGHLLIKKITIPDTPLALTFQH